MERLARDSFRGEKEREREEESDFPRFELRSDSLPWFRSSRVFSFALSYIHTHTYISLEKYEKIMERLELFVSASPPFLTLIFFVPPFCCFRSLKRFDRATGASYPSLESVSAEFTRVVNPAVVARSQLKVVKGYINCILRRFEWKKKKSKTRDSSSSAQYDRPLSPLNQRGNEKASIELRGRKQPTDETTTIIARRRRKRKAIRIAIENLFDQIDNPGILKGGSPLRVEGNRDSRDFKKDISRDWNAFDRERVRIALYAK